MANEKMLAGKRAELFVFGELLKRGIVPYTPLIDVEGVDAIIRTPDGGHLELQIKSVQTEKYPMWFQVVKLQPSFQRFVICVEPDYTTWIISSLAFAKYATVDKKRTYDLDLDSTARGTTTTRKELLVHFKENWALLSRAAEDLEDLLAMYDSLMAPEEESMTLAEYEAQRRSSV